MSATLNTYRRIDHDTVQRILDAADIVEVVSDFVTLKRRGANYIGLCPFHNERTPSFSVSKSRGICKCFSCGKGGSPVNFLMELESMSYNEALRWLAKKYGIEIKEREMTDREVADQHERESMLAVNAFAMEFFETSMSATAEGRDIGRAYFAERGINEQSIRRFHLGYAPERETTLPAEALRNGYTEQSLVSTGLCARNERGLYDRFRGRVIYPVFSLSGRTVAFGGRTLRSDKNIAKYVNSPESIIYSKSRELYGMYQARKAIVKADKCILVEGYMDVISMSQNGVENVVASSGTSLTEQQVQLIHRFTSNVTVIYDSDAAGIKASLRGIDMLLREGLNVKVLSLPPGEDPDSFAQSHSPSELERYLAEHEVDFITFKSNILLHDAGTDPIKRSTAIADILRSIAVIPDSITRQVYMEQCSRAFDIADKVLSLEVAKYMAENQEAEFKRRQMQRAGVDVPATPVQEPVVQGNAEIERELRQRSATETAALAPFEAELLRYVLRYGMLTLCDTYDEEDRPIPLSVLKYVEGELTGDEITFAGAVHARMWDRICALAHEGWEQESVRVEEAIAAQAETMRREGIDAIRREATNMVEIDERERLLNERIADFADAQRNEARRRFLERVLCSDADNDLRTLANNLAGDRYVLSKVHTKYSHVETEEERLPDLVPRAVYELKNAILCSNIRQLQQRIKEAASGSDLTPLMQELIELNQLKGEFARYLGERIIAPGH